MNIKRRLTIIGLILSLIVLIFGGRSSTAVYADTIEHTHIWATKYDSTNHWEYCTVCGEKRNVTAHVFTDHWYSSSYACGGKASIRTCSCGYSYKYTPQHVSDDTIHSATYDADVHYKLCKNCGAWSGIEGCYNKNGKLSCINPGKCSICGGTWPENRHSMNSSGGICDNCHQRFYTITDIKEIYSSDYKSVDISFVVTPANSSVEITGSGYSIEDDRNVKNVTRNITQNSDGSTTFKYHLSFNEAKATAVSRLAWRYDNIKVNGQASSVFEILHPIWMDHTAPTVSEIKQTDQKSHNGYATIKQLDISGTEDYANAIKLSIIDKETGKKLVDKATTAVTDNKWSYTCTPPLEAGDDGRTYIVQVEDINSNVSSKEFTIYKTDGTAPQIESSVSYTDWTNTAKTITLTFTDYGSGDVQASLDNQSSYKICTKTADGKYQITYTFSDDVIGNKTHKLYLRDGLGNAGDYDLVIGNIDRNTYNINYDLNGGAMSGQKTNYTVADSFALPTPIKTGYTFTGWTGSNGTTPQKTVTVNKGTRENLNYTANWQENKLIVRYHNDGGIFYTDPYKSLTNDITGKDILDTQVWTYSGNVKYFNSIGATGATFGLWDISRIKKTGYTATKNWHVGSKNTSLIILDNTVFANGQALAKAAGKDLSNGDAEIDIYPEFTANTYTITYDANDGTLHVMDETIAKNNNGTATAKVQYDTNRYYVLGIMPTRQGYTFKGFYDAPSGGIQVLKPYNPANCLSVASKYYNENNIWKYTGNVTLYAQWEPVHYTIKYDANGGTGTMADTSVIYDSGTTVRKNAFIREGYTFTYWYMSRINNGKVEWFYGKSNANSIEASYINANSWYEEGKNPSGTEKYKLTDEHTFHCSNVINDCVITAHAQWQYNSVSIKVPQVLTGDHTGESQFRVKCDDFKAGSIKITVPDNFLYKQEGKADVTALITSKSGNNIITSTNKVCVYDITTKSRLSAGCWQGNFNIGLTLTKE